MALIDSVAFEGATATGYFYIRIEVLEFDRAAGVVTGLVPVTYQCSPQPH